MTTIAVIHDGANHTIIGSDTQITMGNYPSKGDPKWVQYKSWAIGYIGELRAGNILERHASRILAGDTPYEVTEAMRAVFGEHGFRGEPGENDGAPDYQNGWILARADAVWDICYQLSYAPIEANTLWARGSGAKYAIGAGKAFLDLSYLMNRTLIVEKSIQIAALFDLNTGSDNIWVNELNKHENG